PHLRTGGYAIDFWGVGFDVAERMEILPEIRRDGYNIKELRLVNAEGRRVGGFEVDFLREAAHGRYVTIARSDLARHIYRQIEGDCETIFGDSITEMKQRPDGVEVTFEHTSTRRFDVVIGADGLHSTVRQLAFGDEKQFEEFLGYSVAAFEVTGYPHRDEDIYVNYSVPGKQVGRLSLRNDRTLFLFVFADERGPLTDLHETAAQKEALSAQFGNLGWECPQILAALDSCPELYFDRVSQIQMPTWSKGRVGLVGDAAFCPSLLAGQGSALAMAAAYVLAGELGAPRSSAEEALKRYEERLHPFMLGKQEAAKKFAGGFTPRTRWGLFLRNQVTKAFAIPLLPKLLMRTTLLDRIDLPAYAATGLQPEWMQPQANA
ncbi:MAG TPA: FAD-dependent monooxygenase, partial [Chthoniobacterales bacterium]|nr:FAD-dependent monooxygenase [Chthoniobacterales bacterium]